MAPGPWAGTALDDLLLPWPIDLQLRHFIQHQPLLDHIDRAGITLWRRPRDPSS